MQTSFSLSLPEWLVAELDELPEQLPTVEDRMALVNRLADRNFREGNGGPFAAIVVDAATGRLVSVGVNVVLSSGISAAHAEVMALGLAQRATGVCDVLRREHVERHPPARRRRLRRGARAPHRL
jgi:hypothetical protein